MTMESELGRPPIGEVAAVGDLHLQLHEQHRHGGADQRDRVPSPSRVRTTFPTRRNYLLAVVLGATYIVGALGAQPGLKVVRRVWPRASSRAVLAWMMLVMGLLCALPQASVWTGGEGAGPVWVMIVLYSPLSGVLWPLVESYVSGGRSGDNLRRTVSLWNVIWSSALVAAYVGIVRRTGQRSMRLWTMLLLGVRAHRDRRWRLPVVCARAGAAQG